MSTLATRDELVAYVTDLLDRDDITDDRASTAIRMTEARLNRLLEDPEMEVTSNTVAAGDATVLPADFGEMVSISTGDGRLSPVGPVEFASFNEISGTPRYYVIRDGAISFAPGNSTANIEMIYRRRIPALTDSNTSNWLLALAPDVYVYGLLVQLGILLGEDDRLGAWKGAFDEAIAELKTDGDRRKWGAGPISPRIGRQ